LGLSSQYWHKGNQVDAGWTRRLMTGENLKPQRLWQEPKGGLLPVFTRDWQGKKGGISRSGVVTAGTPTDRLTHQWQSMAVNPCRF